MDLQPNWHAGAPDLASASGGPRARGRGARAGLRRPLGGRSGPDHRGEHARGRAGAQRRVRGPAAAGCGERSLHGPQHGLHELPLRALHRHRARAHCLGAHCARDRRRGPDPLRRLGRPQHGRPLRRRGGRGGRAGERARGGAPGRADGLLRRRARDPRHPRRGRPLCEPRPPLWLHGVALRRAGDFPPCRGGDGGRVPRRAGEARDDHRRRRSR